MKGSNANKFVFSNYGCLVQLGRLHIVFIVSPFLQELVFITYLTETEIISTVSLVMHNFSE